MFNEVHWLISFQTSWSRFSWMLATKPVCVWVTVVRSLQLLETWRMQSLSLMARNWVDGKYAWMRTKLPAVVAGNTPRSTHLTCSRSPCWTILYIVSCRHKKSQPRQAVASRSQMHDDNTSYSPNVCQCLISCVELKNMRPPGRPRTIT